METKLVRVPFDLELAKKITSGEVNGKIITREGDSVRILCWDKKDKTYPLAALVDDGTEEGFKSYTNEGVWNTDKNYTLEKYDLMLEIPEYMMFKDGDVLYVKVNDGNQYIFIYLNNGKDKTFVYAALDDIGTLFIEKNRITDNDDISELRFATEKEKQKLIDALKVSKKPKAKNYLELFFGIEQKHEYEFKPKDWVLCRNGNEEWCLCRFSHVTVSVDRKLLFVAVGGIFYSKCIPYNEQTAHLLGTTDNWEE